jgi:hypothetical protein
VSESAKHYTPIASAVSAVHHCVQYACPYTFVCILCSLASLGIARHTSLCASIYGLVTFFERLQGSRVSHAVSKGVMSPVRKSAKHAHTNRISCFRRPSSCTIRVSVYFCMHPMQPRFARNRASQEFLCLLTRTGNVFERLQGLRVSHAVSKGVMSPVSKSAKHAHTNRINCFSRP